MTWVLTEDEIVKYWELIKYGLSQVERPSDPGVYFLNYLKELLLGKIKCLFLMDASRTIKIMWTFKITESPHGGKKILGDVMYAFIHTTDQEKDEGAGFIFKYAKNVGAKVIEGHISNPKLSEILEHYGFTKTHDIYRLKLGE